MAVCVGGGSVSALTDKSPPQTHLFSESLLHSRAERISISMNLLVDKYITRNCSLIIHINAKQILGLTSQLWGFSVLIGFLSQEIENLFRQLVRQRTSEEITVQILVFYPSCCAFVLQKRTRTHIYCSQKLKTSSPPLLFPSVKSFSTVELMFAGIMVMRNTAHVVYQTGLMKTFSQKYILTSLYGWTIKCFIYSRNCDELKY